MVLSEDEAALIKAILTALRGIKIRDIDKVLVILSKGERRSWIVPNDPPSFSINIVGSWHCHDPTGTSIRKFLPNAIASFTNRSIKVLRRCNFSEQGSAL
jgi:hypothetical protein